MYAVVQEELSLHAAIRFTTARPGPAGCNTLEQTARVTHSEAVVWTGSMIPTAQLFSKA